MMKEYNPELVVLTGDSEQAYKTFVNTLDDDDYESLLSGEMNESDTEYIINKYPELMGIAPIVAKIIGGVVSAAGGIFRRIRARRKARRQGKSQNVNRQKEIARQMQQNFMIQEQQRILVANKKKKDQKMMIATVAGTGLLALLLLKK
jgi:predicted house-cleaning noncanonical NTP pyrophosphatase (MazG superfamily)